MPESNGLHTSHQTQLNLMEGKTIATIRTKLYSDRFWSCQCSPYSTIIQATKQRQKIKTIYASMLSDSNNKVHNPN